jgi:hypothetical protein
MYLKHVIGDGHLSEDLIEVIDLNPCKGVSKAKEERYIML